MGAFIHIINWDKKEYLNPNCKYGEAIGHFNLMEKLLYLLDNDWKGNRISLVRNFNTTHYKSIDYKEILIEDNEGYDEIMLTYRFLNPNNYPSAVIGSIDIKTEFLKDIKSKLNLNTIHCASVREDGLIGWKGIKIQIIDEKKYISKVKK